MAQPFVPILKNPHLLTIAGNFWPRSLDTQRFPVIRRIYNADAKNSVLVLEQQPTVQPVGHILFLHGLEGSADAGYIHSLSQAALERGFAVHRKNMRTCGGTEELSETMYHSGLTSDVRYILMQLKQQYRQPLFVVGFSLGGNVALKLAGELGHSDLVRGFCAVSTPIDLARCVRTLDKPGNLMYARRFLDRLRKRIERKSALSPQSYSCEGLDQVASIWEFDDRFTAPLFGFGTAENYYATQSASRFLDTIRIPTLVVTAKDDPLVPFEMYGHPAFTNNPALQLLAVDRGGHLGFISRHKPRFWLDGTILDWIQSLLAHEHNLVSEQARNNTRQHS